MNEGILNKIGRFFLTKSGEVTQTSKTGWESLIPFLAGVNKVDGTVEWNDWGSLMKLYFGTAGTSIFRNAKKTASVPVHLYTDAKTPTTNLTRKAVDKKTAKYLMSFEYIQQKARSMEIEEIVDHEVLDLLSRVNYSNKRYSQFTLLMLTQEHLELTGNGYWRINRNDKQKDSPPYLIRPIMPQTIRNIVEKPDGTPEKYVYGADEDKDYWPAEEIIHFWYPGPFSMQFGTGPAYLASGWINIEKSLLTYTYSSLENMGVPPAVVNFKDPMPEKEFKLVKEEFENIWRGAGNKWQNAYTTGEMEITKIGWSPEELGIDTIQRLAREMVAGYFELPISKLTMESSNRAVAQTGKSEYLEDTISSRIQLICEELTESLLPMYPNTEGMYFAPEDISPDDIRMKVLERNSNLQNGVTTRNEEREEMEKPPKDGGDELLVPQSLIPISAADEMEKTASMFLKEVMEQLQGKQY